MHRAQLQHICSLFMQREAQRHASDAAVRTAVCRILSFIATAGLPQNEMTAEVKDG